MPSKPEINSELNFWIDYFIKICNVALEFLEIYKEAIGIKERDISIF